jgi:hypothetical protein
MKACGNVANLQVAGRHNPQLANPPNWAILLFKPDDIEIDMSNSLAFCLAGNSRSGLLEVKVSAVAPSTQISNPRLPCLNLRFAILLKQVHGFLLEKTFPPRRSTICLFGTPINRSPPTCGEPGTIQSSPAPPALASLGFSCIRCGSWSRWNNG